MAIQQCQMTSVRISGLHGRGHAQAVLFTVNSVSSFDMLRLALAALALPYQTLAEELEATGALALDDACASDACDLSLRQLRGESRTIHAGDMREGQNLTEDASEAPKFNYNWNFGCTGKTDQEKPAGDDLTFNLNWNFCFDEKTLDKLHKLQEDGAFDKKPGNCRSFGCTKSFDFMTLMNECQCFPGCDKTFLGNTCCPDYKSQCEAGEAQESQATAPALTISGFTTYANAHCENSQGALELSSSRASPAGCAKRCEGNAECQGFTISAQNSCTLLAGINIPACGVSPGKFSTYVRTEGPKPPTCSKYMADVGCKWTADYSCPDQVGGAKGTAGDDGKEGYKCCCELGWWKSTRLALPAGVRLRIVNKYSDRALFAKKGDNWEMGCGAGTPKNKVGEDGYWTLVPQGENQYRIVNQLSNRALYAKKPPDSNWEWGWGAGSPPNKVWKDGIWTFVPAGDGSVRIVNVESNRALYAKLGGHGEASWSGGVGAGYPPNKAPLVRV
ncbi:unnamed protein product [Symbiodinium natans]|uniref:SMB domain-containing protein n=1 Tax=Symbiodinium natans TaxID=878477 RepID=A0A812S4I9_9DINO|nr:unnamed protein product [Symbiodinium natans]